MLTEKFITLGITGGIAAYKAAELASTLTQAGAEVHVIMTRAAQKFIRPITFQALTGQPVHTAMFTRLTGWRVAHVDLATRSDLIVIVPATANILGKLAHGIADDLLSTTLLAATCLVLLCPAMNTGMYQNPIVQANINRLKELGYCIIEPATGWLACGQEGPGRLPALDLIFNQIKDLLIKISDWQGLTVMVTAGGTKEPLDPIRHISNRSSGKMGYALARAALKRGAQVILISAPTGMSPPAGAKVIWVERAREMYEQVLTHASKADVVFKAAAVADYSPRFTANQKIKKKDEVYLLELEKTPDILFELGQRKQPHQILVGFAAETENLEENARRKLAQKNLDLIVANDVTQPGSEFGQDTNIVKIIYPDGKIISLPQMEKTVLAHHILDLVLPLRLKK
ncbi:phosphopantothenoylcysteine decarboxylase [Peptococcaceae bacterium SCADC1_2_3]|jgi:phosphopantothenoylcysteine decarboxylase/phosphopantothenate--cysteine ligase|nr:phosphopantothenoylcysteine decarboxylase [Peptococcaceae bacterium SCADC1_2_3]KFI35038.1 phosphopantothenoylcysteine decarboxylase [Peptococcaceae bacterium SCADC1_2_3]KFI36251.1 phosphopantothenoylcysteine decarboxylase [Peptococcaceae bacterium SCADC1_2_3]